MSARDSLVLTGGADKHAVLFDLEQGSVVATLKVRLIDYSKQSKRVHVERGKKEIRWLALIGALSLIRCLFFLNCLCRGKGFKPALPECHRTRFSYLLTFPSLLL